MQSHSDDWIISQALAILRARVNPGESLASPQVVRDYLAIKLAEIERETFWVCYLDVRNRVLSLDQEFVGTVRQTSVYPREIVKSALRYNASSVILVHNHPSGIADYSSADESLTRALKDALAMVDVTVLDHFIVAGGRSCSMAERGLL